MIHQHILVKSTFLEFKTLVLILFCSVLIVKVGTAQSTNFAYTLSSNYKIGMNDVVESDDGYVLVGWRYGSNAWPYPYLFRIDNAGNFTGDSLLSGFKGYYSNIFSREDGYIIVVIARDPTFPSIIESGVLATDNNLQLTDAIGIQTGSIQNCKIINDSTLVAIGKHEAGASIQFATIKKYNLYEIQDASDYIDIYIDDYPVEVYDIVKVGNTWRIFVKQPDLANSENVTMVILDENFEFIDGILEIETSYNEFNAESKFIGPVTVMSLTDSTFMIHGVTHHPVSENEENTLDAAVVVWDDENTELQLNFFGVPDTNSFASRHSIARNDDYFYFAGTKNYDVNLSDQTSFFMLTKTDLDRNVIWTKYYGNGSRLKLTNVIATADGGALMVGDSYNSDLNSHNIYVVKIDADGILNSVETPGKPTFSSYVFPNPSTSEIYFSLPIIYSQNAVLEVYDSSGKQILHRSYHQGQSLNVSGYHSGVYFYRLQSGKYNSSGKFVIGKS